MSVSIILRGVPKALAEARDYCGLGESVGMVNGIGCDLANASSGYGREVEQSTSYLSFLRYFYQL